MRRIFLITFSIIFGIIYSCDQDLPLPSSEVYSIAGKIVSLQNGEPISNALVSLNDYSITTDTSGKFIFLNLSKGNYTLSIVHSEYLNYSESVVLPVDSSLIIRMYDLYSDYFPLEKTLQIKYRYSYGVSYGPPRPSSIHKRSIATWDLANLTQSDSGTIYSVIESRVDTVELTISGAGTFRYLDTLSSSFSIIEDDSSYLSSEKFPGGLVVPRYFRGDIANDQYFSNSSGIVSLRKDVGIIKLIIGKNVYTILE